MDTPAQDLLPVGFVAALGVGTAAFAVHRACAWRERRKLKRVRAQFQEERAASLQRLNQELEHHGRGSTKFEGLRQLGVAELTERLREGSVHPLDVLRAYQSQAMVSQAACNCLVEPVEEAETWARELLQQHHTSTEDNKEQLSLLAGIPISIKDDVIMKGYTAALGVSTYLEVKGEEDCLMVQILKSHGAIPYVRTTVSQDCLSYECSNPITGRTLNPHDPSRTSGASSGGECALVGAGGSLLGIGSDMGGSIRLPAHFCGVVGFKPSAHRLSQKGLYGNYQMGQQLNWACWGPIAREVEGAVRVMRALLTQRMFNVDPRVPPLPFNEQVFSSRQPLKLGYCVDVGDVPATPACKRALMEAKAALESQGHKLVEWQIPHATALRALCIQAVVADGGVGIKSYMKHDDVDPCLAPLFDALSVPGWWNSMKIFFTNLLNPKKAMMQKITTGQRDVSSYWCLTAEIEYLTLCGAQRVRSEVFAAMDEAGLDGLILPPSPLVASKHGSIRLLMECQTNLVIFNLLDMPAGVVPVSHVMSRDLEELQEAYKTADDHLTATIVDDQADSKGLPIGVQCVSPRWRDEVCLRIMADLEAGLATKAPAS